MWIIFNKCFIRTASDTDGNIFLFPVPKMSVMEVYIEYVILDNLAVNTLIVLLTVTLLRLRKSKLRVFAASVIGTAFAVAFPFIGKGVFFYKICCATVMVLVYAKYGSVKKFALSFFTFLAVSFLTAGALSFMIDGNLDISGSFSTSKQGIIGFTVLASVLAYYLCVQVSAAYKKQLVVTRSLKKIRFGFGGKNYEATAFADTGNCLYDTIDGSPVIVLSKEFSKGMISGGERKLTVKTVNGSDSLPLITLDDFCLEGKNVGKVKAVVSLSEGCRYDVILHCDLLRDDV